MRSLLEGTEDLDQVDVAVTVRIFLFPTSNKAQEPCPHTVESHV